LEGFELLLGTEFVGLEGEGTSVGEWGGKEGRKGRGLGEEGGEGRYHGDMVGLILLEKYDESVSTGVVMMVLNLKKHAPGLNLFLYPRFSDSPLY